MDALIVAGLQRVEHYEIAAYGTMAALAKAAGQRDVARLLAETLKEEKETDAILTGLAERDLNPAMVAALRSQAEEPPRPANDRRGGRRASAA
jgi:ferritin-like metal-binding protein YciE